MLIKDLATRIKAEDAPFGDITSRAIFTKQRNEAHVLTRQNIVVSGWYIVKPLLKFLAPKCRLKTLVHDGAHAKTNQILAKLYGPTQELLFIERTLLNFLQHFSGIATFVQKMVLACPKIKILHTRKTLPLYRAWQVRAVQDGGGSQHRQSLSDHFLIKNNHIDASGSIAKAIFKVQQYKKQHKLTKSKIMVEVRNQQEFGVALKQNVDVILLDNMTPKTVKNLLTRVTIPASTQIEVSGGIYAKNIKLYKNLPIHRLSMGCLTHSVQAVDIAMKLSK